MHKLLWRYKETKRRETRMGDEFDAVCGVGTLSRWKADVLYKNMDGCSSVVHSPYIEDQKVSQGKTLLVALKGEGVRNCGMTDVSASFEIHFFSAAGGQM